MNPFSSIQVEPREKDGFVECLSERQKTVILSEMGNSILSEIHKPVHTPVVDMNKTISFAEDSANKKLSTLMPVSANCAYRINRPKLIRTK